MGSAVIAGFIAHGAFWVLLVVVWGKLGPKGTARFLILWLAGYLGLPDFPSGGTLFASYVAVLDVVLALRIFKRDVKLH